MDRLNVGDFRGADHSWNVEIALRQLGRADADGFISETDVEGVTIRLAINGYGSDPQFLASADHSQRNLAAVCNQNFLEHSMPGPIHSDFQIAKDLRALFPLEDFRAVTKVNRARPVFD